MPVRVSYGRATCAGHKQSYVRNELGPPSTQVGPQMRSSTRLGQVLCPAQHAISMSRGPPTTPTTAASRRRGRCSPGGSVERAVVATGAAGRQVAAFSGVNWYCPENILILNDIFLTAVTNVKFSKVFGHHMPLEKTVRLSQHPAAQPQLSWPLE